MRSVFQDLHYGARILLKAPGFTAVAVLTLAIGIAANTTVFSWIENVLVRPLPGVRDGQRLVVLEIVTPGFNQGTVNLSYAEYRLARENLTLLSGIAAHTLSAFQVGDGQRARRVWGELVSGNYFSVLGVEPTLGRVFLPEEYSDTPGGHPVAVIGERLWRGGFNADPGVVGRTIRVNRYPLTIVGVVPGEFRGTMPGLTFDIWVPVMMTPQLTGVDERIFSDGSRSYWAVARLAPGVTIGQAQAEVLALVRRAAETNPGASEGQTATLRPVWRAHTGAQSLLLAPLQVLMAVCALVLLIVCANVANLLLARSSARQREFAIRLALGAGRARLARQLLTETLLLAGAGALLGLPLARWMSRSLSWLLPPSGFPVGFSIRLDANVLAFTTLVCVAAALVSGSAPVLRSTRPEVSEGLKEGGRGASSGGRSHRLRSLLVVAEVALALVALIGSGLFVKSLRAAQAIPPGFDPRDVSVAQFQPSSCGYSAEQGKQFCVRLSERLRSAAGVVDVAYSNRLPLGFGLSPFVDVEPEGYMPARGENMQIYYNAVSPGFFDLMRIPRLEGRDFTELDDVDSSPVMIVNQSFARRFFADGSAVGRRVRVRGEWATVAGVVKDSKYHTLAEAPLPYFYVPFRQAYSRDWDVAWYLRSRAGSDEAQATLRREAAAIDPNAALSDVMPLSEYVGGCLYAQKVAASLLSVLAALSLLLAALGLYGVMAYAVSQRTHEIGIRMALGAQAPTVLRMVVREGMVLAGAGLLVGLAVAYPAARLVASMLVNVSSTDPVVFLGAPLFLAAVALLASYVPARRATRVSPGQALRCE
jgi:predicted permease